MRSNLIIGVIALLHADKPGLVLAGGRRGRSRGRYWSKNSRKGGRRSSTLGRRRSMSRSREKGRSRISMGIGV